MDNLINNVKNLDYNKAQWMLMSYSILMYQLTQDPQGEAAKVAT